MFGKRISHTEGAAESFFLQALLQSKLIQGELKVMKCRLEEAPEQVMSQKQLLAYVLNFKHSLKNARQKFSQVNNKNNKLGTAKVLLLKAEFYVNYQKVVQKFLASIDDAYTHEKCLQWLE